MENEGYIAYDNLLLSKLFGRKVYYTNEKRISSDNVIKVLNAALSYHNHNRGRINYLERYYRGDQPILRRVKAVRPEINNKIVENFTFDAVGFHTSQDFGEPIKYVSADADGEDLSDEINKLNRFMKLENKGYWDIELGYWQNICGTAYRFILPDPSANMEDDECPFSLDVLDPRDAFVVYSSRIGKKPIMGVRRYKDEDNIEAYDCYTRTQQYTIKSGKITETIINPIGRIPIIEYPKNSRRIGMIELTITITNAINMMQSNRLDGIEQFVQAFMKFVNCEIDRDKFLEMCQLGAIKIKGEPGLPADVEMVSSQLDQGQTQISKEDLYKSFLIIQGMPSREQNTGGDTGSAVYLRNGWDFAEKRTEIGEPIIEKSEREFIRIALKILSTKAGMTLKTGDVDIKIVRNKTDNMLVKTQALQMLLQSGVDEETALTIVELFSDPQKVYAKSKDRMEKIYNETETSNNPTVITDGGSNGSNTKQTETTIS